MEKKFLILIRELKKKLPKISTINKINYTYIDLIFLSLPNGEAQKFIKNIYHKYKNIKFIDLSADFRISDIRSYLKNYKINPQLVEIFSTSFEKLIISTIPSKDILNKEEIVSNPLLKKFQFIEDLNEALTELDTS